MSPAVGRNLTEVYVWLWKLPTLLLSLM